MAANRILIICCIVGIVLGYAVGTFVDSVNLNTALTIGLIGGLGVGYLLDKSGAQTGSGTAKTAAPSSNDSVERAKAALAAARGDAAEKVEEAASEVKGAAAEAKASVGSNVDEILARARGAVSESTENAAGKVEEAAKDAASDVEDILAKAREAIKKD